MHMADALLSPAVGGVMWAATAGVAAYSVSKVKDELDERKIPLMGVMGAFVFASQMINFSIPGTGSSGHLGGGLLLAILLGPYAGFLTMACILGIQALFFADGGLLALGSNIFNMGFFTCFIVYPFIFKPIVRKGLGGKRVFGAALLGAVVGLQLGALGVVVETTLSGITELPFSKFLLLMQPIHLAIGIIEGLVTAVVASYIWRERPEIIETASAGQRLGKVSMKKVFTVFAVAAILVGGLLSWFASSNPDGLEWSMFKTSGQEEIASSEGIHDSLASIQEKTAILPDYGFKAGADGEESKGTEEAEGIWPVVDAGTTVSGIVGGLLTMALAGLVGGVIYLIKRNKKISAS